MRVAIVCKLYLLVKGCMLFSVLEMWKGNGITPFFNIRNIMASDHVILKICEAKIYIYFLPLNWLNFSHYDRDDWRATLAAPTGQDDYCEGAAERHHYVSVGIMIQGDPIHIIRCHKQSIIDFWSRATDRRLRPTQKEGFDFASVSQLRITPFGPWGR